MEMETVDGVDRNESEKNGILIESEFAFVKAVREFLREEVWVGGYKGNYVLNVKEQLRMRTLREEEDERKVRVMMVGSSQLKRIANMLQKEHGDRIEIVECVRIEGEEMAVNMERARREVLVHKEELDVVLVRGPGNSLVVHGKEGEHGFAGEREVRIAKKVNGEEDWTVQYHLTDPVKITMAEKVEMVDRMVNFMEDVMKMVGEGTKVMVVTVVPRFVKPCCKDHMTEEDVWLLDGLRRDVNREIRDKLVDRKLNIEIVEWWSLMGQKEDLTITDIRK
jgi:hypothetical protein